MLFRSEEEKREIDSIGLWDLSYAKILYDPKGKMEGFIESKLSKNIDIISARQHMWSAYWSFKLAGDIWIYRQDTVQGHLILNNAIIPMLSALFIANKEHIPHEKWIVHMSRSLNWLPEDWDNLIMRAMSTNDCSINSLIERQEAISKIWHDISDKLCEIAEFNVGLNFA